MFLGVEADGGCVKTDPAGAKTASLVPTIHAGFTGRTNTRVTILSGAIICRGDHLSGETTRVASTRSAQTIQGHNRCDFLFES